MPLAVAAASAALLLAVIVATYNRLVRLRNGTANAFGALDAQLRNRFDLIPNIVAAVSGYVQHERSLLESLTALRAQALRQLVVAVEAYPDLKASQQFDHLQRTLVEVEAQIAAARRAYNAAVTELNNGVQSFPAALVAGPLGFSGKPVLETPEAERGRVDVSALLAR